jgi:2-dehydropantoate 2-reductase
MWQIRRDMAVERNSRIVVAGAGSIGCYVGGCLALAGRNVTLLLRPVLADAISRHGLRISDLDGADRTLPSSALTLTTDPSAAMAAAEIVLVTVKSGTTADMAKLIARHAPPDAVVVSLQNGVGNVDALWAHLRPAQRAVAGMVPFNVVQSRGDGDRPRFHRATSGTIRIAAGVAGLREALDVPGAAVAEHADMVGVLWGKLLLNLNNALNALSDLPLAKELADRRWRLLLAAQIEEALAVLKAADVHPARIEGVPPRAIPSILRLPNLLFRLVARRMLAIDPRARSSMSEDLRLRRPTEIDHLQGAILELADKAGMAAPITERILRLVKGAESAGAGSPGLGPGQVASVTR